MTKGWLLSAGLLGALAALAYLACIAGGPSWERAIGAGERFASALASGSARPAAITLCAVVVLALWSASRSTYAI